MCSYYFVPNIELFASLCCAVLCFGIACYILIFGTRYFKSIHLFKYKMWLQFTYKIHWKSYNYWNHINFPTNTIFNFLAIRVIVCKRFKKQEIIFIMLEIVFRNILLWNVPATGKYFVSDSIQRMCLIVYLVIFN